MAKKWKFTERHLPDFIFLVDVLFEACTDDADILERRNEIALSAEERFKKSEEYLDKSVYRAYKLRMYFKGIAEAPLIKYKNEARFWRPSMATLNYLSTYHDNEKGRFFDEFKEEFKKKIEKHYRSHRPDPKKIDTIFNTKTHKIVALEYWLAEMKKAASDFDKNPLDVFLDTAEDETVKALLDNIDVVQAKTELKVILDKHIDDLGKRLKKTKIIYGLLGNFGVLFISLPKVHDFNRLLKENLIFSYSSQLEALGIDGEKYLERTRSSVEDLADSDLDEDDIEDDDYGDVF